MIQLYTLKQIICSQKYFLIEKMCFDKNDAF